MSSHFGLFGSPFGELLLFLKKILLINWKPLHCLSMGSASLLRIRDHKLLRQEKVFIELHQHLQDSQDLPIDSAVRVGTHMLLSIGIELVANIWIILISLQMPEDRTLHILEELGSGRRTVNSTRTPVSSFTEWPWLMRSIRWQLIRLRTDKVQGLELAVILPIDKSLV